MKTTNWKTNWLAALLTAGCVWLHTPAVQAIEKVDLAEGAAPAAQANTNELSPATNSVETETVMSNAPAPIEPEQSVTSRKHKWNTVSFKSGREREVRVVVGKDVELKAGESAEAVVVIGGSAKVNGKVRDAVVAIMGNVEVGGEVGDAVVAVMGNVKVRPEAKIHGDVVSVGGRTDIAEGATVKGHTQDVDFGMGGLPGMPQLSHPVWLKQWVTQCVLMLRPLSPQVGWVWTVAGAFFLFYLLITVAFPKPIAACVDEMMRRPITTFLMGLLTKLLAALVLLLLVVTVVGLVAVPFVVVALLLGSLFGKAAFLQFVGAQIGRQTGFTALQKPLVAFLVGWILITLLYIVPILGLLVFVLVGLGGLGAAVMATFSGLHREVPTRSTPSPAAPSFVPPPQSAGIPPMAVGDIASGTLSSAGMATPLVSPTNAQAIPPVITAGVQTALPEALTLPRAGFWERMGAAFLDVVLVSILGAFVGGLPFGLLVALAYFAGMWAWRGMTIGGIVLNLKVVRYDGQPVSFAVALVRALAAAFSTFVLFLGFFWIAWDRDKQGWHDKIAGTVVVRQPRGTPLICL